MVSGGVRVTIHTSLNHSVMLQVNELVQFLLIMDQKKMPIKRQGMISFLPFIYDIALMIVMTMNGMMIYPFD